jgi:hypothetical protein
MLGNPGYEAMGKLFIACPRGCPDPNGFNVKWQRIGPQYVILCKVVCTLSLGDSQQSNQVRSQEWTSQI